VPVAVHPEQTTSPPSLSVAVIIPARYASSRFPGKPLALLEGSPMIEHVYRRAAAARAVTTTIVATDDERIRRAVEAFGGRVQMTRADHPTGTDRLAEVARGLTCDIVVNVQGDEPLLDPRMIDEVVAPLAADPSLGMSTVRRPIDQADWHNPNVVKVVVDAQDYALYFSRAPLPYARDAATGVVAGANRHIGLYAYRRTFLLAFAALPQTPLERAERLEQLRALEHGHRIKAVETAFDAIGVDTPDDLERVRELMARRKIGGAGSEGVTSPRARGAVGSRGSASDETLPVETSPRWPVDGVVGVTGLDPMGRR
jgi:3-deoxy-manno-octulosonate cytidylyltransferase (CMP-KDO synthetase)